MWCDWSAPSVCYHVSGLLSRPSLTCRKIIQNLLTPSEPQHQHQHQQNFQRVRISLTTSPLSEQIAASWHLFSAQCAGISLIFQRTNNLFTHVFGLYLWSPSCLV